MLEGLLAPLRVVLQRSLADWLIVVATWLVIVCATTLLSIGVLYGDAVALSSLHRTLADEPVTSTSVEVSMRVDPGELSDVDGVVSEESRRILGWTDGELARIIRSGTYDLGDGVAGAADGDLAIFEAADRLADHAAIVDGEWPRSGVEPLEAAVSIAAAETLGLSVGDELEVTSRAGLDRTLAVRVAGLWEPEDPEARYWLDDGLQLTGVTEGESFTVHGPFVVTGDDLVGRIATGELDVRWRTLPQFENLALENVGWMRSDAASLERRVRSALGGAAYFDVSSDLARVLGGADRSLLVSRSGVMLLTIQFVILAGYALVLVAGLLVEQRRIETALLRSRGASAWNVGWMAVLEGLLLVVPAAIAAPWLALGILGVFDAVGPLAAAGVSIEPRVDGVALVVAAAAGAACLVGLVIPAFASGRGLAAVRSTMARQGNRTLAQRAGLDLVLVALAAIGLWQLRQYGAPITESVRGSLGLDPLLVAAPAIGLLAGAILALRVVPMLAQLAERVLGTRRGLVGPLGARQLARRPLRYTRSALLLMLAAALGTFAASYTTTWTRSQTDQAAYQSGGDLLVDVESFPDLPVWAFESAYEEVAGVERAMPVVVDTFDTFGGGTTGDLLALDTDALADVAELRSDLLDGQTLAHVVDRLKPSFEGLEPIPLPGEPVALVITLDTALEHVPPEDVPDSAPATDPLPAARPVGTASVAIRDAAGMIHTFVGGDEFQASAAGQELEIRLGQTLGDGRDVTPAYPLELMGITLLMEPPAVARVAGEVALRGIDAVGADGSSAAVDADAVQDGWTWLLERGLLAPEAMPSSADGAGTVALDRSRPIVGGDDATELRLVPDALAEVADRPLPIAISRSFADATAAIVGDRIAIGSIARRTEVEITAILDAFPTLAPDDAFGVMDIGGYAIATYARSGDALFADQWWLSVSDEAAAAAALRGEPYSVDSLLSRSDRLSELTDDPVALGVIGALAIGSIAALIVAVIGFVVSAVVTTRERLGEFALLRAMGLSPGQLSAWLTLENAFLLGAGMIAGTALGMLLSWLVLPFVTLTAEARVVVPPVLVEIPWIAIGIVHAIAAAALVVSVVLISGVLRRVPVSGVLRAGGD